MNEETIELLNEQIQVLAKDIKTLQVFLLILGLILFAFLGILAKLGVQKLEEKLRLFEKKSKKDTSTVKVVDSKKTGKNNENHEYMCDEENDSGIGKNIGVFGKEEDSDGNTGVNNANNEYYPPIKP